MALKFAHAWGCEVTAFSSSPEKEAEARGFGAADGNETGPCNAASPNWRLYSNSTSIPRVPEISEVSD